MLDVRQRSTRTLGKTASTHVVEELRKPIHKDKLLL